MKLALTLALAALASATAAGAREDPVPRSGPVQQLRIYRLYDASRIAFHERFRTHATRIMARYGFDIVAMWEARSDGRPEFVYVLRWPDEATMRRAWEGFMADAEWAEIKRQTAAEHGPMVESIQDRTLHLTDYSPPIGS
ncbi:NIPSNAP family protein [Sphingosinicella sp. LHD-64]|uniref:NIPSNAP family protein n=1 Tax=Sphingosinicella sp. LHD-64 TaxID=3072139 RepID=UPI00280D8F0A|nr:NIPSNAP family protein [Sphingosinicella sp. LHD-64]MDQ8757132.1 NIPSNAP family protein [Sphingosinicella sp. LHD-64]